LLETQRVSARILLDAPVPGTVLFNLPEEGEVTVDVATAVDLEGFEGVFWERVMGELGDYVNG
jgi:hypothetical protein